LDLGHDIRATASLDRRQAHAPDIIAASTTPATQAAKNATRSIPIVMIALGDPVRTGLVESLAQPGANVTRMSMMVPELATKRLELLKEAVPAISRVLVLSYLADPIAPLQVKALQQAAPSLGVTLQIHDIQRPPMTFRPHSTPEPESAPKGFSRRPRAYSLLSVHE
jgi:ABC-type uncharacterized transport system substrate-binding protein